MIDSLEIGKTKYIELRRILLTEGFKLPGYNRLAIHRSNICLTAEVHLPKRDNPVNVGISYRKLLTSTVDGILSNTCQVLCPVDIRISNGLDGSGCHRKYQQAMPHPDLTTKNILLFCFKVLPINSEDGVSVWTNLVPNSPFLCVQLQFFSSLKIWPMLNISWIL